MHKVTDRSSVQAEFSIPVLAEACSSARDWFSKPGHEKKARPSGTEPLDPLYLFGCSVLWHKQADAAGAWELIHGLHSANQGTRAVASALLIKRSPPVREAPRKPGASRPRRGASHEHSLRIGNHRELVQHFPLYILIIKQLLHPEPANNTCQITKQYLLIIVLSGRCQRQISGGDDGQR